MSPLFSFWKNNRKQTEDFCLCVTEFNKLVKCLIPRHWLAFDSWKPNCDFTESAGTWTVRVQSKKISRTLSDSCVITALMNIDSLLLLSWLTLSSSSPSDSDVLCSPLTVPRWTRTRGGMKISCWESQVTLKSWTWSQVSQNKTTGIVWQFGKHTYSLSGELHMGCSSLLKDQCVGSL